MYGNHVINLHRILNDASYHADCGDSVGAMVAGLVIFVVVLMLMLPIMLPILMVRRIGRFTLDFTRTIVEIFKKDV